MDEEERKAQWRASLLEQNANAIEAVVKVAMANGAFAEDIVVLVLDVRDKWAAALAKRFAPDVYEQAAAGDETGIMGAVTWLSRSKITPILEARSRELARHVAAPPPSGRYTVVCVSGGFAVSSAQLPMSGAVGDA